MFYHRYTRSPIACSTFLQSKHTSYSSPSCFIHQFFPSDASFKNSFICHVTKEHKGKDIRTLNTPNPCEEKNTLQECNAIFRLVKQSPLQCNALWIIFQISVSSFVESSGYDSQWMELFNTNVCFVILFKVIFVFFLWFFQFANSFQPTWEFATS